MFLSIIVPVYNVESYLPQCLNSLKFKSEWEYEIILVTGKSRDNSNRLCHEFYKENRNVKLVQQNGTGLSNARNCGLSAASGEYISFVDSDDYLIVDHATHFFDDIHQRICEKRMDIVANDFYMVNQEGRLLYTQNQIPRGGGLGYDYTETFISKKGAVWNAWRFVFRRAFLVENALEFKENSLCEDLDFSIRAMIKTNRILYIHDPFYCYRGNRQDSLFNRQTAQSVSYTHLARGGDTNVMSQLGYIYYHFFRAVKMFIGDIVSTLPEYVFGGLGKVSFNILGTMEDKLAAVPPILMVFVLLTESWNGVKKKIGKYTVLWIWLLTAGVIGMMWVAMYLAYTPVGARTVVGVQPRYYAPLIFPIFMTLTTDKIQCHISKRNYSRAVFTTSMLLVAACIWGLVIFV